MSVISKIYEIKFKGSYLFFNPLRIVVIKTHNINISNDTLEVVNEDLFCHILFFRLICTNRNQKRFLNGKYFILGLESY